MTRTGSKPLPDVGEVLAPVLARVAAESQPLLVALAERLAANRYRGWARDPDGRAHEAGLLECANREEEIASRIEALHPDAASIQREIMQDNPGLEEINRSLFADRPIADQFTIQARGERLGAATWRAFAKKAPNDSTREVFLTCAGLEETNAAFLEAILDADA